MPARTSDCFTTVTTSYPPDENDRQWSAKELNEALIVKFRGVLGENEGDLKGITLLIVSCDAERP